MIRNIILERLLAFERFYMMELSKLYRSHYQSKSNMEHQHWTISSYYNFSTKVRLNFILN